MPNETIALSGIRMAARRGFIQSIAYVCDPDTMGADWDLFQPEVPFIVRDSTYQRVGASEDHCCARKRSKGLFIQNDSFN